MIFFGIFDVNSTIVNMKAPKTLFPLKVLLDNNYPQFDKSLGMCTSKTCHVETKPVSRQIFFMKLLVNTTTLKVQMIISQSMME